MSGFDRSDDADGGAESGTEAENGSVEAIRTGDVVVGILLALGAVAWLAAGLGRIHQLALGGATVRTNALGTGLVTAGFLAHALDRALADERAVAGVVTVFAVGLATAFVGRSGGDRTVWAVGGLLMVLGGAGYAYLQFWPNGSGSS